ncbi:MAG: SprB repeat-containing protein [Bacteroidales bacterium]|nr:SprB repeat-containing protein [Bacteroidales bacterium]
MATGGTSPFTYLWNDPSAQTLATATGLAAGTYTVTITDANGCTATAQAIITQPTALSGGAVATSSTCGNANGSVDLSVSGGTPAYTYAWSNGATTQDLVNVVANTYSVTITDANGCTATSSATVNNIGGRALPFLHRPM